eukprot:3638460-Pyramimonas_sp.AAC.1
MRTRAWAQARRALNIALEERCHRSIRAPRSLWALLHRTPWAHPTWDDLRGTLSLEDAIRALSSTPHTSLPRFSYWSVRYLRSCTAGKNQVKHALLTRVTMNNSIALIPETHWSEHEAEVWKTMFRARTVVASPGFLGPPGGLAGGVGILLPHGTPLLDWQDMVPGCAVAAIVQQ